MRPLLSTTSASALTVLLALSLSPLAGQSLDLLTVGKSRDYLQGNTSTPVPEEGDAWFFNADASTLASGEILAVSLTRPDGTAVDLQPDSPDGSYWELDELAYPTQSALDAAWPNGVYTMQVTTGEGPVTQTFHLTGDSYPPAPHFTNFTAAQTIDPFQVFTMRWDGFAGATPDDLILFGVYRTGGEELFQQFFDSDATEAYLDIGILQPGRSYEAELVFARIVDSAEPGGGEALTYYVTTTRMPIRTTGEAIGPDYLDYAWTWFANSNETVTKVAPHTYRPNPRFPVTSSRYNLSLLTYDDTYPPPAEVEVVLPPEGQSRVIPMTFAVPLGDGGRFYGMDWIGFPPVPPDGFYTVNYGNDSLPLELNPSFHQGHLVVIDPTFTTDQQGRLVSLTWEYRNPQTGAITTPSFFRERVELMFGTRTGAVRNEQTAGSAQSFTFTDGGIPWSDLSWVNLIVRSGNDGFASSYQVPNLPEGAPWPGAVSAGVYRWVPWFGFFYDELYPWVFQNEIGWLYTVCSGDQDIWFYDLNRGWLWTSATQFPFLFSVSRGAWAWVVTSPTPPQWFVQNPVSSAWETWP